ncbi:MAG: hypothetical protein AAF715_19975 [Myxococcota bacterium]
MNRDRSTSERIENPFAARRVQPRTSTAAAVEAKGGLAGLRAMTGFEEEAVERWASEPNTARLCNRLLAHCLVPPGDDPTDALARVRDAAIAERDVALVQLRRMSLGDRVEAEVACSACGRANTIDFALSALPLPEGAAPSEVRLETPDGSPVVARLPTAGDQEALLDETLETAAERRTWLIARLMTRHGDRQGPFDPAEVHALPTAVRRAIETAIDEASPTVDLSMQVICDACGHQMVEPFDVAGFFLLS